MTCSAKLKFRQKFIAREILLLHAVSKMVEQDEVQERIASCVRGYHIYKEKWTAAVGEMLCCAREVGNVLDRYAVSVLKDGDIVGHLPRKISKVCSLFLRRGGSISCEISGTRRCSRDLLQGGLEVPCTLILNGKKKELAKVKQLIQ